MAESSFSHFFFVFSELHIPDFLVQFQLFQVQQEGNTLSEFRRIRFVICFIILAVKQREIDFKSFIEKAEHKARIVLEFLDGQRRAIAEEIVMGIAHIHE